MPTATLQKFQDFSEQLGLGVHNFGAHALKVCLTNTAPASTAAALADITQISAGGGYSAGGYSLSGVTWSETSGTAKLVITDQVITASGASIGPFRYVVMYNSSATSPLGALIGYLDYGSALTLADGESLTLDFDAMAGVLTIS